MFKGYKNYFDIPFQPGSHVSGNLWEFYESTDVASHQYL